VHRGAVRFRRIIHTYFTFSTYNTYRLHFHRLVSSLYPFLFTISIQVSIKKQAKAVDLRLVKVLLKTVTIIVILTLWPPLHGRRNHHLPLPPNIPRRVVHVLETVVVMAQVGHLPVQGAQHSIMLFKRRQRRRVALPQGRRNNLNHRKNPFHLRILQTLDPVRQEKHGQRLERWSVPIVGRARHHCGGEMMLVIISVMPAVRYLFP
jgi:hypothetical protein